MATQKTWFITGCSTGFGRILVRQLLEKSERVVATSRKLSNIEDLKTHAKNPEDLLLLELDVTNSSQISNARDAALKHFGRIDVLINNAGYGSVGAIEETSMSEIKRVYDTNVFGLIEVTQAFLPTFREQKSGHIINLSSVAGMVSLPGAGIYCSTKFAVEGISEALRGEMGYFGVKVTLIEPGAFRTDFANRSLSVAPYHPAYTEALATTRKYYETIGGKQPGNPEEAARIMIELVDHENPPLRLILGKIALDRIEKKIEEYLNEIETWESVTLSSDYPTIA